MKEFSRFFSTKYSLSFLQTHYEQIGVKDAKAKAFHNCSAFISFLKHGGLYFKEAKQSPIEIKPLLLFYGLLHYLKACILLHDPNYPATSIVLAHGVSTRKRKKTGYEFLKDEIRIQKNGLFAHAAFLLFHLETDCLTKFAMYELFSDLEELTPLFNQFSLKKEKTNLPEILIHYLLLYNLSMIVRYETEWWFDCLHQFPFHDLPFIESYLAIVFDKIPFLLSQKLDKK